MEAIKSFTDLEQSKKLAEILPLESADMCYIQDLLAGCKYGDYKPYIGDLIPAYGQDKIKCWSLAALLNVIPTRVMSNNVLRIDKGDNDFSIWYDDISYGCVNEELPDITTEEPIDACYEMIVKLREEEML